MTKFKKLMEQQNINEIKAVDFSNLEDKISKELKGTVVTQEEGSINVIFTKRTPNETMSILFDVIKKYGLNPIPDEITYSTSGVIFKFTK